MEQFHTRLKTIYVVNLLLSTGICLLISGALSIIFWLSFSDSIYLSFLFILFAVVFEIAKIYAFIEGYLNKQWLRFMVYAFLTIISVAGSAGGLYSLLQQKQEQHAVVSHSYQQLEQQITQTVSLIETAKALAVSDLSNNYRTEANHILNQEIPALQNRLDMLQQQQHKLVVADNSPASLSIHLLPMIGHMPTQNLQKIFIIALAILIDLISAFLISLSLTKIQKDFQEDVSKQENILQIATISAMPEEAPKKMENNLAEPSKIKSKNNDNEFIQLCNRVATNIKKQVYPPLVTYVMTNEKVGYAKAKRLLQQVTH